MGHFLLPKMTPNQHSTHTVRSLQLHDIDITHVANDFPTHCLGWNSFANILFIDQPAGTGFSYVTNPDGYVKNETTIGIELWNMMLKFYELYPKYANLDLYIFGESYGKLLIFLKCAI